MFRVRTVLGKDSVAAGERHAIMSGINNKRDPDAIPVVYAHHATGGSWSIYPGWTLGQFGSTTDRSMDKICRILANAGHPVIAADLVTPQFAINQTILDRLSACLDVVSQETGCRNDKCLLLADSLGTLTGTNWAMSNPDKVVAAALSLPAGLDLQYWHDTPGTGWDATIDTFFGSHAAYLAALPTWSPRHRTEWPHPFIDIPTRVWAGDADTIAPSGYYSQIAAQMGAEFTSFGEAAIHEIPETYDPYEIALHLIGAAQSYARNNP